MRSFALLSLMCVACSGPSAPPNEGTLEAASSGPPAIVLSDVDFVSTHGSQVFASGHVATLTYLRESGDGSATQVKLRFPREGHAKGEVDISAPRAHGNPFDEQVVGEGGVVFANARGDHGTTEAARYDGKRGEADGDRPVELWGPSFELKAPGFHWHAADDALDLGPSTLVSHK